ncbi:flagellar filament capping protein FliD [Halomonas sp. Bachu 37]|uniref:flagellar filament capping protein FliD n=1 Tax=Halomonas kashgarensis TaxID=3084920 RepID=UPI003216D55F
MASISSLGVGSGLDLSGLLDQLRSAERQKLQPITQQKTQEQAKVSAYGRLKSGLSELQDAVGKLNSNSLYQGLKANVQGGEGMTATTSAEANPGRYEVAITNTARAGSLASTGVSSLDTVLTTTTDTASLQLTFGDAEAGTTTKTVELEAGLTLEGVRDAINADPDAGVNASIINDGSENGYRLVLSSKETGAEAGISGMSFANFTDANLKGDAGTHQKGLDAKLKINGIDITSSTNTVEGAIQGVTLQLDPGLANETRSLIVEKDEESIREAVQSFVDIYNKLDSTLGRMTQGVGEAAGELVGDRTVRTIETGLSRNLTDSVLGGELTMMSQVGISLKADGRLELDTAKLNEVMADNPQALADFFAGADEKAGMAGRLEATLGRALDDENGMIQRAVSGSEARVASLDTRFERTEQSIERTISRYQKQFSQLDSMMSQMNSTSGYLFQQLNMINGQMASGN